VDGKQGKKVNRFAKNTVSNIAKRKFFLKMNVSYYIAIAYLYGVRGRKISLRFVGNEILNAAIRIDEMFTNNALFARQVDGNMAAPSIYINNGNM